MHRPAKGSRRALGAVWAPWAAWALGALALACGGGAGALEPEEDHSGDDRADDRAAVMANEWDLLIQVQFMVDESLSAELRLDPRGLRDFRYERRGDVGDGTEEVIACTGTLPDAEHEALAAALDLGRWDEGDPFSVTVSGGAGPEAQWLVMREVLEGHTPIPHAPPGEAAVRAMIPTLERTLAAIRAADGTWSTCTTRLDPP